MEGGDRAERATGLGENKGNFDDFPSWWAQKFNRDMTDPNYREEWAYQQCFAGVYFVQLSGCFKDDRVHCTHSESSFDGRAMFEYDRCDCYVEDRNIGAGLPEDAG